MKIHLQIFTSRRLIHFPIFIQRLSVLRTLETAQRTCEKRARCVVKNKSHRFYWYCSRATQMITRVTNLMPLGGKVLALFSMRLRGVPAGSPSPGEDATVYVREINQPSLHTSFYFVLVSISVFVALSIVFHSIIPPTALSFLTVLPLLFLPYWSF